MSRYSPDDLAPEQIEVLNEAAFLIISARKEARAMLARSGLRKWGWVTLPRDGTAPRALPVQ